MKIAIIIAGMNLPGGIERVISLQANYWVTEAGYDVCLLTHLDEKGSSFYPLDKRVRNIYLGSLPKHHILDIIPGVYPLRVIKTRILQYKKAIIKEQPDVILTMMHGSENYYMNNCSCGIPVIGVNHITLDLRRGVYEKNLLKKTIMRLSYAYQLKEFRKYQCIVALSRTDNENLIKLGCHSTFIPNPRTFEIEPQMRDVMKREKTIIMVGRFDYHKGQDRIVDIWKDLAFKNPDWKLILVGDGAYKQIIREQILNYHLERQVVIMSNVKDVGKFYCQSSIFVLTSRTESFGMVILEAMSNGLPCCVYDCENGPRDIIVDGVNGFLVPDGNKLLFEEKLQRLMDSQQLRSDFIENSNKTISNYSINHIMSQWNLLLAKTIR